MNNVLTDCIREDREYPQLLELLIKQRTTARPLPSLVTGLCDGATDAMTVSLLTDTHGRFGCGLIICPEEKECVRTVEQLKSAGLRAVHFPIRDLTLYNITASHEFEYERLRVLSGILEGSYDAVVTTPDATLGYTIPPERLKNSMLDILAGDTSDPEELCSRLSAAGFCRVDLTENAGQFARRGGIIDIFPPYAVYNLGDCTRAGSFPVRIEFFGDDIDRICIFDPETQRGTENIGGVHMTPAREVLPDDERRALVRRAISALRHRTTDDRISDELTGELNTLDNSADVGFLDKYITLIYPEKSTLAEYFPDRTLMLVRSTQSVGERLKSFEWMSNQTVTELIESGTVAAKYAEYNRPVADFDRLRERCVTLHMDSLAGGVGSQRLAGIFNFRTKHTVSYAGNYQLLCDDLQSYVSASYRIFISAENATAAENLRGMLADSGFRAYLGAETGDFTPHNLPAGTILIRPDAGVRGYELVVPKIAVLTTRPETRKATAGASKIKKSNRRRSGTQAIMSYNELNEGDLIVHESYGIGRYLGIENLTVQGVSRDYIKLQFAGSDRLFLPVEKMDLVSRYIGAGADDANVKLSHFGGTEWGRAKAKARAAVADIAKDLIQLYAQRMKRPGYAFPPDDDFQQDFEVSFEYTETEGQLNATDDIKADMMRPVPMDRLLCGDVGYGKTEVAFRAAYKAVLGGRQVAILVPTTILALQHYQTAVSRMRGFPVTIDMVSRFRTPKQQAATLRAVARGDVDIIIGTHRLLSKDVQFSKLGLLIIDEEQRFGVAQKEKIKQLCGNIDVLSLSATPIPRTLNMAMGGIRDISVLDEAPGDRLPVQTYVLEHDDIIITEAIRRELRRGGQVFYLHNEVENIDLVAGHLREVLPDARIVTAHGKMDHEQLENIWEKMLLGEIDILVCTTIIETGVDVPNANTLIVDNAHRLGLSQLHQIRGRVGRSSRRAYAYFTYPPNRALTEIAEKRLEAVREYAEFGAGFRIALRDLELRGAGNLLGSQQHGHLDAVGYDLYIKMLNEAVLEQKGEKPVKVPECTMTLDVSAFVPGSYVPSAAQRMALYKRIAGIRNEDDRRDITDELIDRYGDPPKPVMSLLRIALIRARGRECGMDKIVEDGNTLRLYSDSLDPLIWQALSRANPVWGARLSGAPSEHIALKKPAGVDVLDFADDVLKKYIAQKSAQGIDKK